MKDRKLSFLILLGALFSFTSLAGYVSAFPSADIASRGLQDVDFPRSQELAPGIYAYEGLHSPLPDGTVFNTVSLIIVTNDGVMVVDGQGDVWQTKLMIDFIEDLTSQPIKYVVVASDHGDHVGGNAAFKAAYPDVQFISSPVSQLRLSGSDYSPEQIVTDKRQLTLGDTEIEVLNLGRAHTGGDLAVYLPESKILFLSEIYMRGLFPAMRSAYPSEWVVAIEKAQSMDVSWFVPGHGFIDDAASMERDLETYRQAIAAVIDESARLHAAGELCESPNACPAVSNADWGQYGTWDASDNQAPFAIRRVYHEIEGTLDGVQSAADQRSLTELWEAGQVAFGQYVTQTPYTVQTGLDLAQNMLLDYAFVSLESQYDVSWARDLIEGLERGSSSQDLLVRIPSISDDGADVARARVQELLALGVDGVVIPHVRSLEEARQAVSFFEGFNVWSPDNPDGDVIAMLMLETPEVFEDLEEVANIPGYSVLACGIGSLTRALDGDRERAERLNLELLAQTQRVGMADIITADPASVAQRVSQGFLGLLVFGPDAEETLRLGRAAAGRE
ncbi:MBL fold metallo-hydrolase [Pseudohongiella spirulinae]|uniref:2,4-dihydroxyhept-2-ene-1,7-dioic acid aldolase n=1 Tax=Pseudohongiella spirulinae TaxID=1249552 RepID=A0A0S2KGD9_9GAMM|nr:MBL fold metallo-hydrolase [Pseudohongiella spirulinae]ALO47415.1 2,4-dihydroxyhept-2-ene-1,7-dioic acid aldolase [Pseudohongiella spirulinae]